MAAVSNQATTYNLENYVGELFNVSPTETPFLSAIGGLTGGESNRTKQDTWQTTDLATAEQPENLEGADPTYSERDRSEVSNVKQIHQYGVEVSYTKQAATQNVAAAATPVLGSQPVQNELQHQLNLKLQTAARDVDYSFIQGTYQAPANNSTARKTRGMHAAITTNTVSAGSARLTKAHVDEILRTMWANGAPLNEVVAFCQGFNKQRFSEVYGYAPDSRTVGGVDINTVITDFGPVGVALERQESTSQVLFADLAHITPTFLEIPMKGHFFLEPKPASGASFKWMLYGEIGLKYGPEQWHGEITSTATS